MKFFKEEIISYFVLGLSQWIILFWKSPLYHKSFFEQAEFVCFLLLVKYLLSFPFCFLLCFPHLPLSPIYQIFKSNLILIFLVSPSRVQPLRYQWNYSLGMPFIELHSRKQVLSHKDSQSVYRNRQSLRRSSLGKKS